MVIEIKNPDNYNTELYNLLKSLPSNIISQDEDALSEPLEIYSASINKVFQGFENILKEIENKRIDLKSLDLAHEDLLDSILEFIDDGYLIMKCFNPKSFETGDIKKIDDSLLEKYKQDIFPYIRKITLINKKVKVSQAKYCHVEALSSHGKVMGYYIEGATEDGVIQPDKEIHKEWTGMKTAISYNKDIRDQLANVYFIAHHMANTVRKIVLKNHKVNFNIKTCLYDDNKSIEAIFKRVNSLKTLFLPDEYNDDLTQISIGVDGIQIRRPAYRSYINRLLLPNNYKIRMILGSDETNLSWALPY